MMIILAILSLALVLTQADLRIEIHVTRPSGYELTPDEKEVWDRIVREHREGSR
jgi:hypothetical protein